MLYTKFKGDGLAGFGEDFWRVLLYMGMAAILVTWPGSFEQTSFHNPIEALYEIWLWLAQQFLRRRCLKSVDDGACFVISSPISQKAQVS